MSATEEVHEPNSGSGQALNLNKDIATTSTSEDNAVTSEDRQNVGDSDQPAEYYCGVGRCRPSWLQRLRDARLFVFLLCCNTFIQGALVSGFSSVVLSTIERRYRFSSTAAGLISSMYDMAILVSVVFISYFGGKGHKPRWLGISLIIQGIGAFVYSLPQFVFGSYQVGSNAKARLESCDTEVDFSSDCTSINDSFALAFFFIGNILIGVGAAPLFTIGTAFLDEIIRPKYISFTFGFVYMFAVVGPALGFGLGAVFLNAYVDPWLDTNLEPDDPGWVGAWWLCFLFSAVVSWLLAIPFLLFPRLLPNSFLVKKERELEMAQECKGKYLKEDTDLLTILKSFPRHLKQVVTTLSWLFITGSVCSSILVLSGMVVFAPKYLESQFTLTASTASLITGGVAIPSGAAGVIVGALIVHFTKAKGRQVVLIHSIISTLILPPALLFLLYCPNLRLAGVTVPYSDGSIIASSTSPLSSTCSTPCMCNSTVFEPVCGADGLTYFSPCQAACQKSYIDGDLSRPVFENCSCIADNLASQLLERGSPHGYAINDTDTLSSLLLTNGTAVDGRCDQGCNKLGPFLFITAVIIFFILTLYVPYIITTVRCVADEQRTLALGLQSLLFRAFGSIPGPIVFGVIIDSACLFWQFECDRRGNCWVYNNVALGNRGLALALCGVALNFIFSLLTWLVYPKTTAEVDREAENNKAENPTEKEMSTLHSEANQTSTAANN